MGGKQRASNKALRKAIQDHLEVATPEDHDPAAVLAGINKLREKLAL